MFADLHLHSIFSDGTYSPEELAMCGKRLGLVALALTDHDTVEGCAPMATACKAAGIGFIMGTELTAGHAGNEIHFLGYFVDTANKRLLEEVAKFQAVRQNRIREMVALLNKLDISLEAEKVFQLANCRSPGRPHVARALVNGGYCRSFDEAFERFLKKNRPAWVPKFEMPAEHAIELIHGAGGLAVMAHPGLNRTDDIIPDLVEAGLDGLECFHSKHSTAMMENYVKLAERHNLLITGGSDCHGDSKGKPLIGTVKLPFEYVRKLFAAKKSVSEKRVSPAPK
jgi:hypothetical protein